MAEDNAPITAKCQMIPMDHFPGLCPCLESPCQTQCLGHREEMGPSIWGIFLFLYCGLLHSYRSLLHGRLQTQILAFVQLIF